jgi:signal transduction histidine kinase
MTRGVAGAVVVGLSLAVLTSVMLGKSVADTALLLAIAGGASVLAGILGAVILHMLRRRSLAAQTTVVALTSTFAVVAAALGAGLAMFLSQTDLDTLGVVVLVAGSVGLWTALMLAHRITAASRLIGEAASRLGDWPADDVSGPRHTPDAIRPSIREFADLASQLEDTAARLEAAHRRERALDASRRELVAWVSHDLRTPLAGIRAMTEALEDRVVDDPETVAAYHRSLRIEAERVSGLVDDLFELSRISAGALQLTMETASLSDLVSDALAGADAIAAAKGVHLEGKLVSPLPQLSLSTPAFSRVLRNLLVNAIRETPADGVVAVEAGADEKWAWVAVADSCGGIPAEHLPRVFEAAYRGDPRTPVDDARAGLGLAIAKGLVEAHNGDISVSNAGKGCRFLVRLPLVA